MDGWVLVGQLTEDTLWETRENHWVDSTWHHEFLHGCCVSNHSGITLMGSGQKQGEVGLTVRNALIPGRQRLPLCTYTCQAKVKFHPNYLLISLFSTHFPRWFKPQGKYILLIILVLLFKTDSVGVSCIRKIRTFTVRVFFKFRFCRVHQLSRGSFSWPLLGVRSQRGK